MSKETKNHSMGWLKGVLSNNAQPEQKSMIEQPEEEIIEEPVKIVDMTEQIENEPAKKDILSKDDQDKVALDSIVALENILQDRQLILYKNKGLENQLHTANEMISRLKHDQVKKDQLLLEKNKEIRVLESNLTNKQMSYDQLLEDYKDFQNKANIESGKLTNQLEIEIHKYNKLKEEATEVQYKNMNVIKELEEKIRDLEVENQNYVAQYEKSQQEKAELMQTINDFTERMSISFSSNLAGSANQPE
ncbi:hypothetical protein [Bacillus solimangrovi]|uniref:Uncharacterized protein n=1 Tax=Bacillus solimangrovi TaxID=1305675 RepID=A0A1E5LD48_9BACI|nr:hypothetical protein [Bacillus solimangrovi]OEH92017.1 hypothetical protein BFG57_17280 [Bacillus solimangrovi]